MVEAGVSVVIPARNAARFLAAALESVFAQTHRPHEVIVVDDGSTDATAEIAREFPLVRLLAGPHRGVSSARNRGVEQSDGEFIAFLDADDVWHEEKLARQLALANATPSAGMIVSRQDYRFMGEVPPWFRGPTDGSSEPGYQPSNWLIRRSAWDRVGQFNESMTHSEDTDWLSRAVDLGIAVAMVEQVLVTHRIHDANASGLSIEVREGVLRALRGSVRRKQAARE